MAKEKDSNYEGRDEYFMDIDRMVNEGLGGGRVTYNDYHTGLIEEAIDLVKEERPK